MGRGAASRLLRGNRVFRALFGARVISFTGDSLSLVALMLYVADSTLGFGTNGAEAVGPLIAAALFPLLGVRGVLLVDAATFLVSAGLLVVVRPPAAESWQRSSLLADARSGLATSGRRPRYG